MVIVCLIIISSREDFFFVSVLIKIVQSVSFLVLSVFNNVIQGHLINYLFFIVTVNSNLYSNRKVLYVLYFNSICFFLNNNILSDCKNDNNFWLFPNFGI